MHILQAADSFDDVYTVVRYDGLLRDTSMDMEIDKDTKLYFFCELILQSVEETTEKAQYCKTKTSQ